MGCAPALAATAAAAASDPPPAAVQSLLKLLDDPAVQSWLRQARDGATAPVNGSEQPAGLEAVGDRDGGWQTFLALQLGRARDHLTKLASAAPQVATQLGRAGAVIGGEMAARGFVVVGGLVLSFAALGFGAQALFWRLSTRWRQRVIASPLDTVEERLRAVFQRLVYGTLMVGSFAIGSIGAFLVFPWPPLLAQIVTGGLLVFLAVRVAATVGRFLLAPGAPRFRVLPMPQASAQHWFTWSRVIAGYAVAEIVLAGLLRSLRLGDEVAALLILFWGFGGLALALVALFRRPAHREGLPGAPARTWIIACYLGLAGLARSLGAVPVFALMLIAAGLPAAILATRRAVAHLLRPPGAEAVGAAPPGLVAAGLERALQAVLILGGLWLAISVFGVELGAMAAEDAPALRLLRGALNALLILLAADVTWHLARSWIDRQLFEAAQAGEESGTENESPRHAALSVDAVRRRARLLTLLPILRNVGFAVLAVMAVLMALSALGLQVGPLLAGAGVVGVAVGFGAQTLVKDIISGMFYLLDDAFRVGEYIVSGSYKGTVESFSLRSIKLRHHRGPLFTVPFGELGAVQNLSRDWVIDKIQVGVTYDTDLARVKQVIKQVSREIMAEPELAQVILEPLKSQGVYAMGDFAIQVRMKIKTRPGEQFVVRRVIYDKIKKAFDEAGIHFAFPTVTVASGSEPDAAIAQAGLEMVRKSAAV